MLSTVAGATITVAGIAFSVSLLTIQLASSQYSPRVVSGLFRDPFNKRVIGIVVGTFTYCLVVLRSVRSAIEQQGQPVVPNVSVAAGVLFGIAAVLAIIAFINHNAHAMDISEILDDVTRDAIDAVERHWSSNALQPSPVQQPEVVPEGPGLEITFDRDGWVQLLDHDRLLGLVPEGGTIRLDTAVGRYVVNGSPLCTLWPAPSDGDEATKDARAAVHVGETRTLQQDASYGIRQLADVALKALSPGVNDPTTAQDAIFHIASVLRAFLHHDPPNRDVSQDGRRLILAQAAGYEQLIGLAFDEVRIAAAPYPSVVIYLLESIALLQTALGTPRDGVAQILDRHASLIMQAAAGAGLGPTRSWSRRTHLRSALRDSVARSPGRAELASGRAGRAMNAQWEPTVLREYALVADGERGIVVGPHGEMVWLCFPRWDSPAVFASLIGGGGGYQVVPSGDYVWGGSYEPGSLIWRSRWVTGSGVVECREALSLPGRSDQMTVLRRVTVQQDSTISVKLALRSDFGQRGVRDLRLADDGCWRGRLDGMRFCWTGAAEAVVVENGRHHDLDLAAAPRRRWDPRPRADPDGRRGAGGGRPGPRLVGDRGRMAAPPRGRRRAHRGSRCAPRPLGARRVVERVGSHGRGGHDGTPRTGGEGSQLRLSLRLDPRPVLRRHGRGARREPRPCSTTRFDS